MPTPQIQTFLFDVDGTLIDSVDLILRSFRHTMTVHQHEHPSDDVWIATLGRPLWDQFGSFTEEQAEIDAMVETYRAYNLEHHDSLLKEYPGVRAAVEELRSRGKQLGVVTSKLRYTAERGLALCGFDGLFDAMVAADDVDRHKPDPTPVLRALEILEADPGTTVYVGDSPHDMVAGNSAGVRTAAVSWGPFSENQLRSADPTYWISSPSQLSELG